MRAFSFWHPERPLDAVDILFASPISYSDLMTRSSRRTIAGIVLHIAGTDDLKAMKQGTGREQDRADIDALERLEKADG